jgi:ABC-type Mn2+/Zn2+ transport system ATPase subunit
VIRLSNVKAEIGEELLFIISELEFNNDKSYLLTGDNGTGKSSLLKAFIGEFPYITGDIKVDGEVIYQPQDPYLYQKKGKDNFALFNIELTSIENELAALEMFEMLDKPVDVLSGGQRQKIAFLRSISLAQDILLLDEPFSQMDDFSTYYCLNLSKKWLQEKKRRLLIIISHDPLEKATFDAVIKITDKRLIKIQ